MNGRERIEAALNGVQPDRVPIMLHNFWMATRELGITQREYRDNPRLFAEAHIRAVEKYKYDGILSEMDTSVLAGAIGVPVDYPEDEPARCHRPLIESLDDWKKHIVPDIENSRYIQNHLEAVRLIVEWSADEIFVRGNCDQAGFSLATMVRTPAEFMIDIIDPEQRETALELIRDCNEVNLKYIELMSQTGCHMVSNGDSPSGPDMISPSMYRTFAQESEKAAAEKAHELGLPYMLHICGNTTSILDDMRDTGSDAIELDYKTDSTAAYDSFRDRTTFVGNVDPSGVLERGMPATVVKMTEELLQLFDDNPRFILNAGCAIPRNTPEQNLRVFIRTAREYR